jgi:sugar lactone lactonase YvrE
MDIQYLGDASSPAATFATTTKADGLATGAAVDADGSTWGGGTTVFKLTKTITAPAQKGDILVHVKIGAASATVYIDPKVVQT